MQIPREQRAELEEGAAYVSELVGCEVWVDAEPDKTLLGEIADVDLSGGTAPLLVVRSGERPGVPGAVRGRVFAVRRFRAADALR